MKLQILNLGGHFHWSEKEDKDAGVPAGWYVTIDESNFALPTGQEVVEAAFYPTPAGSMLLRLRQRILTELSSYRLAVTADSTERAETLALIDLGYHPFNQSDRQYP